MASLLPLLSYTLTATDLHRHQSTHVLQGELYSTGAMLFAGGMAGCAAWIVTYPIDVIKTRIQKDGVLHKS